jgi:hypothetical protein
MLLQSRSSVGFILKKTSIEMPYRVARYVQVLESTVDFVMASNLQLTSPGLGSIRLITFGGGQ